MATAHTSNDPLVVLLYAAKECNFLCKMYQEIKQEGPYELGNSCPPPWLESEAPSAETSSVLDQHALSVTDTANKLGGKQFADSVSEPEQVGRSSIGK